MMAQLMSNVKTEVLRSIRALLFIPFRWLESMSEYQKFDLKIHFSAQVATKRQCFVLHTRQFAKFLSMQTGQDHFSAVKSAPYRAYSTRKANALRLHFVVAGREQNGK